MCAQQHSIHSPTELCTVLHTPGRIARTFAFKMCLHCIHARAILRFDDAPVRQFTNINALCLVYVKLKKTHVCVNRYVNVSFKVLTFLSRYVYVGNRNLSIEYAHPLFWRACIIKSLCLIMHGVHYLTMGFNNARVIMHACIFNFRQIWQ